MARGRGTDDLRRIFEAALREVDPCSLVERLVSVEGDRLSVSRAGEAPLAFDLSGFDRILVVGAGKASARMANALESLMGDRIRDGVLSVKERPANPLERIRTIAAGHPVPDERSVRAADEIASLARGLAPDEAEKTLVIALLSGGGSSLLASPLGTAGVETSVGRRAAGIPALTLEDLGKTTDALLASGAPIQAMNCVRKHLSSIAGGRLARLFHPATLLALVLSDVVGDRLDTIASGPTTPDESTYAEALEVISRHGIAGRVPEAALRVLEAGSRGLLEETPKRGDPAFSKVHNVLVGTNRSALLAAARRAIDLGFRPLILSSRVTGEAREAAKVLHAIAAEAKENGGVLLGAYSTARPGALRPRRFARPRPAGGRRPAASPLCILAGGETTVTLRGGGKGGRNQELALAFLLEMERSGTCGEGILLLSASTDGSDGPTDAAGAFASMEVLERARALGLRVADFLANNDSYAFFEQTGSLYKTGPTGTNVCDLQIILVS